LNVALTVFQGRVGDRNDLAIAGAAAIGTALSRHLNLVPNSIGKPQSAPSIHWKHQLAAALPSLREMAAHYDSLFT
jgi:arginase